MCSCCFRQVHYHCPRRSQEPLKGGKRELSSFAKDILDWRCSTPPWTRKSQWDSYSSCDLPHGCICDHAAVGRTISDKGSRQLWYLLFQHSRDLKLTFAGSRYAFVPLVLCLVENNLFPGKKRLLNNFFSSQLKTDKVFAWCVLEP